MSQVRILTAYLVDNEVEEEKWRTKIIGKECLDASFLAERSDAEVELTRQDEDNDENAEVPEAFSALIKLYSIAATYCAYGASGALKGNPR